MSKIESVNFSVGLMLPDGFKHLQDIQGHKTMARLVVNEEGNEPDIESDWFDSWASTINAHLSSSDPISHKIFEKDLFGFADLNFFCSKWRHV
jgi:hypothetical protein